MFEGCAPGEGRRMRCLPPSACLRSPPGSRESPEYLPRAGLGPAVSETDRSWTNPVQTLPKPPIAKVLSKLRFDFIFINNRPYLDNFAVGALAVSIATLLNVRSYYRIFGGLGLHPLQVALFLRAFAIAWNLFAISKHQGSQGCIWS